MNHQVKQFISKYHLFEQDTIQQIQLQHRFSLVEAFQIKPGMRILEIGCGQGDTTVVLADAVGKDGHVIAIDIAPGNYGAPFTLAQAHENIQQSSLGNRITFHLNTDFLEVTYEEPFDAIVFSHCSWYFKSIDQLKAYFAHAATLTKKLCFAEWDINFTSLNQRGHFCAVSILALYAQFVENDSNVQHIFSPNQIVSFMQQAGFHVSSPITVDANYLQDGQWEQDYALHIKEYFNEAPSIIRSLADSYYEMIHHHNHAESLHSFVLNGSVINAE